MQRLLQAVGLHDRLRHERDAARLSDAAEQRVQRVDRQRGEQAVGLRQRRAADDRDRRLLLDELVRQPLDPLRRRRR